MSFYGQAILIFVMLIPILSLHEFAHALVAWWRGDDTAKDEGRLTLNPVVHIDPIGTLLFPFINLLVMSNLCLLGWAKPVPVTVENLYHPRWDGMLVALAGPVANLLFAYFTLLIGLHLPDSWGLAELAGLFAYVNVNIALFNLLPFPPLDGWRIAQPLFGISPDFEHNFRYVALVFLLVLINLPPFRQLLADTSTAVTQWLYLASFPVGEPVNA